jgi:hypothetical protein
MAKRKSAAAERYWYAIGYHHGITGVEDPPMEDTAEFLLYTMGLDVRPLYAEGWKRGQKDKENGME